MFAFINLACVESAVQLNGSIYHFCIVVNNFHLLSRAIVVQDFKTVTFYMLFVHKPTFSVIFC